KSFNTSTFDPAGVEFNGAPLAWRYRLDVDLTLTGGSTQSVQSVLFFTERIGGSTQLAGTVDFGGITFELPQEMVDALFALTYAAQNDPRPPAIPAPAPNEAEKKTGNP
ncbi:MAG: hypothetical protein Q8J74_03335, partial [Candidatus Didemnitutus sp.]|nr:hypothetical protein [Candidatus Didemnitutus sp.]